MNSLMFLPVLLWLGAFAFGIYFMVTILSRMKEKNDILKEIRDELRNNNSITRLE
jgi:hypothetical protein